ncbi:MAG: uL15 family ribosomal protein [Parcubacteria group bacterium]|nr:uL15 family ribosomal protein [Parcubacteria group bacterium]
MQLHQIQPIHKGKKSRRIGRGGKRGSYSGRGIKGQRSRAGARIRPAIRDLILRLPKLRGARFKSLKEKSVALNIKKIGRYFSDGDKINLEALEKAGLINRFGGKLPEVKIIGQNFSGKKFEFEGIKLSKSINK